MSAERKSVEELKALFRVGDCVDLYRATEAMAATITEEMKPVTEAEINAAWQSVMEDEDFVYVVQQEGHTLFGIPLLFRRYASFMSLVGEYLGVEIDEEMMGDDWISAAMPKSRAIATALMMITVDYLADASAKMRQQTGTSPAEVFVRAVSTGESFGQSLARLSHAARGLQVVNSKED